MELNTNIECYLQYTNVKDDLIPYKCLCCNRYYQNKFEENLKKGFTNTQKLSNHNTNKFIFLFQKREYMDDWEKFNEISLPEKEDFYSHLKMEDITDADYTHKKTVCKDFKIRKLGEYHISRFKVTHYCYLMYLTTFGICVLKYLWKTRNLIRNHLLFTQILNL